VNGATSGFQFRGTPQTGLRLRGGVWGVEIEGNPLFSFSVSGKDFRLATLVLTRFHPLNGEKQPSQCELPASVRPTAGGLPHRRCRAAAAPQVPSVCPTAGGAGAWGLSSNSQGAAPGANFHEFKE